MPSKATKSKTVTFNSGHVRGDSSEKIDYSLALDGPMFRKLAVHLTKNAEGHGGKRNWLSANSKEEYDRARESAVRHFIQWWSGDKDEDHAAAVVFNMNIVELITEKAKQV